MYCTAAENEQHNKKITCSLFGEVLGEGLAEIFERDCVHGVAVATDTRDIHSKGGAETLVIR